VITNRAVRVFPLESPAVQVTEVRPIGNRLPDRGRQDRTLTRDRGLDGAAFEAWLLRYYRAMLGVDRESRER
jgi:hypothetical protein